MGERKKGIEGTNKMVIKIKFLQSLIKKNFEWIKINY